MPLHDETSYDGLWLLLQTWSLWNASSTSYGNASQDGLWLLLQTWSLWNASSSTNVGYAS